MAFLSRDVIGDIVSSFLVLNCWRKELDNFSEPYNISYVCTCVYVYLSVTKSLHIFMYQYKTKPL